MVAQGLVSARTWTVHAAYYDDRESVEKFLDTLGIVGTLAGNIRQLMGVDRVGAGRKARHVAGEWHRLDEVRWLYHKGKKILVPFVGTVEEQLAIMQGHAPGIDPSSLKNLLNGKRTTPLDGWAKQKTMPPAVRALNDGDSLAVRAPPAHRMRALVACALSLFRPRHAGSQRGRCALAARASRTASATWCGGGLRAAHAHRVHGATRQPPHRHRLPHHHHATRAVCTACITRASCAASCSDGDGGCPPGHHRRAHHHSELIW